MKLELYLRDISAEFPEGWYSKHKAWTEQWTNQWKEDWKNWKDDWGSNWKDWGNWDDWKSDWKENWGSDWAGNWGDAWTKPWNNNANRESSEELRMHMSVPGDRLRGLQLREEKFGGIFHDPMSEAVFKVDHQGFTATFAPIRQNNLRCAHGTKLF